MHSLNKLLFFSLRRHFSHLTLFTAILHLSLRSRYPRSKKNPRKLTLRKAIPRELTEKTHPTPSYQYQEKICLLGRLEVKCGSVVQVEGLRSYKAIAFTNRKGNMRLAAKTYFVLRMSLQNKTAIFPKIFKFRVETQLNVPLMKIGDREWKK
jgi:hypothetical protein